MEDLKDTIAKNLVQLRTQAKLTQAQLAEMLNYSDKAVSKWERGEAVPDVRVLAQLAEIYNVTVDEIINGEPNGKKVRAKMNVGKKRLLITLLSIGLVWFIATVVFMILYFIENTERCAYLAYLVAPFVSSVVWLVYSIKWGNTLTNAIACTLTIFTAALAIHLFVLEFADFADKIYFIYIVAGAFEVLAALWFGLRYLRKKRK